ncbi:myosin-VIIa-like isoform X2 [Aethina tumida]|nr:myosin-VIIa-like isoform X2 [Aethina tumida]XP_049822971.1 myosin-VIIa-like isoform X2 [Aethina tumida]
MHVSSIKGVDDMINLGDLQEYAILRNLHKRYKEKQIYTYTGSLLVAINPYEMLPIYTNALIREYRGKRLDELPPHIFAIGDNSYNDMKRTKTNQCIVISGESGAGKTESTKLLLQYLASTSGQHSWIEQQILDANPIMEAFGNAKTVRNDNSSRFGKYIDIGFNRDGVIEGAKIEQYLLEKSRIVSQNDGERNYHIFYSMLAGLSKEELKRLDLTEAKNYSYLTGGRTITCDGRNEEQEFNDIQSAMKVLNFTETETSNIYTLLAAILHLGNLSFKTGSATNTDSSEVADAGLLDKIAKLLGTNKSDLGKALTTKTIGVHGDRVTSLLSKEQAQESKNAFVKGIYGKMFVMIVDKINKAISLKQTPYKKIGVLDIFGFENFTVNSFEQLCINYANENLQQFFVQHIFKLEQEYYTNEGINWSSIEFIDNQSCLDMIAIKSLNILALIDEESKFPNGTDFSLLSKLHGQHSKNPNYLKPKSDVTPAFGIKHFAGPVFYDIPGFLEKNRDSFSQDLKTIISTSSNVMLKQIFESDFKAESNKRMVTLSFQFKTSLDQLMKGLSSCHPYFVRCIKPNEDKKPQVFDRNLCCRQLRYSGMMETAKIRQAGYPIRFTYKEFVDRFRYLAKGIQPSTKGDTKESTAKICTQVFQDNQDYQLGHTKIFLKHQDLEFLEVSRTKILDRYVLVLQKSIRGWLCRKRYKQLREAAIVMQKYFRARGYRSRFLKIRNGFHRLQALIRSRHHTHEYGLKRNIIVKLQAIARGYHVRKNSAFGQIYSIVAQRKLDEIELKRAGIKNYRVEAESAMQKRLLDLNRYYDAKLKAEEEERKNMESEVNESFSFLSQYPSSPIDPSYGMQFPQQQQQQPPQKSEASTMEPDPEYNFRKYAATYFKNVSHMRSLKPLKDSLHDLPTPDDVLASQALFVTVMRFMGEYPEPKHDTVQDEEDDLVVNKVRQTLSRGFTNRKEFQEILKQEKKMATMKGHDRKKIINMTLKRKHQLLEDLRRGFVEDTYAKDYYNQWLNHKRTNNLEKIHFITVHGILRPELRDEIYCLIMKQLTNNNIKSSYARGWMLLSLCLGCFPPSERFQPYLRNYIYSGPPAYSSFLIGRLDRTLEHGARSQPASYMELLSCRDKQPIKLSVKLLDGTVHDVEADSASTAEEICQQISTAIQLRDTYGFSLYIAIYDKVSSIGFGDDHVMDAVSQCEQYAREKGHSEKEAPWRLFWRKEFFTPWHNAAEDEVATSLIYSQVVGGLKTGEYRCNSEADVALLLAVQCYVENGQSFTKKTLQTRIGEYMPSYIVKNPNVELDRWVNKIYEAFVNLKCYKNNQSASKAKEMVVKYAKVTWPILFSMFYDAVQTSGPDLPKKNVIIAVNWTGIYFIDDSEQILMELSFADVTFVTYEKNNKEQTLCKIQTIRKDEYVFFSPDAHNLCKLIQYTLDGLKKRSVYCVAIEDYKHATNAEAFLEFKKGDLIVLKNGLEGKSLMDASYGYGECNGKIGDFPTDKVYILPTMDKPHQSILAAYKKEGILERKQSQSLLMSTAQRLRLHTLSAYASEHFRTNRRRTATTKASILTNARRDSQEELWKYTGEPIHQPLLQKVLENVEMSTKAVNMFTAVLKYMGDLPAPKPKYATEYTDEIFGPAMEETLLKDELYCQIMRQLTFNRLSMSEERAWELMYLITGLFVPSTALQAELIKFLQSRLHPLSEPCLKRIEKTKKIGTRQMPPFTIEVEAIQQRSLQTFHRIYFPDDTDEAFEIDSMTTSQALCRSIGSRLQLENLDGFSLFVVFPDRVFSVPNTDFFYDYMVKIMKWLKSVQPSWSNGQVTAQYQLFFMKKLWVNAQPGKSPNADHIFHYHQELPKYLKGYHKCSKQDAILLAAYILRARDLKESDATSFLNHNHKEIIPADIYKAATASEWKKSILTELKKLHNLSADDAKTAFLKHIYNWPTFGSTFFEVKQATDPTYPEIIIVAINKKGVNIIHPITKDILATYDFVELFSWSSGNTYFHMTVGSVLRKKKLLFETSQGYKMDDLITSYTYYWRDVSIKEKETKGLISL